MVFSFDARNDVDRNLLTKYLIYRRFSHDVADLSNDERDIQDYDDIIIKGQCTIQSFDSEYVQEGKVLLGDLVGFLRYEYRYDANGFPLQHILVPKQRDRIKFAGQWFSIKQCTPATGEDSGIIGWDITAGQITDNEYELEDKNGR